MIKQAVVLAGCLFAMSGAVAQSQGFYGGLSLGAASSDIDKSALDRELTSAGVTGLSSDADENDVGYKAYLGYGFTPNFAVEGGYANLGSPEYKASFTGGNAKADWESHGMYVQAVGRAPVANRFSLLAKGGVYFAENEVDIRATGPGGSASTDDSDSEINFVFGFGGEYALNPSTSVRFEWERFLNVGDDDVGGEADVELMSLGLRFNF